MLKHQLIDAVAQFCIDNNSNSLEFEECKNLIKNAIEIKEKEICPSCGTGQYGKDSLCAACYHEYLGTHLGARSDNEYD